MRHDVSPRNANATTRLTPCAWADRANCHGYVPRPAITPSVSGISMENVSLIPPILPARPPSPQAPIPRQRTDGIEWVGPIRMSESSGVMTVSAWGSSVSMPPPGLSRLMSSTCRPMRGSWASPRVLPS